MKALKVFIKTHPVLTYFAMAFAISWGGVLLVIGAATGMSGAAPADNPRFIYALVAMLAGPSISGLLLTTLVAGRLGLRELRTRALAWRVDAGSYALALLLAPLLWTATLFALSVTSSSFVSGIFTSSDLVGLLLIAIPVALAAGIFEELGWTGFAIPQLRRHHGMFATGLIVGVVWGAWHLLTNVLWVSRITAGELPLSIFLPLSVAGVLFGYLAAFRVLMVWVYDRTRSMLLAMLMHASLTATVLTLDPAGMSGAALLTYSFALAIAVWAAVALIAARRGGRLEQRPAPTARRAA